MDLRSQGQRPKGLGPKAAAGAQGRRTEPGPVQRQGGGAPALDAAKPTAGPAAKPRAYRLGRVGLAALCARLAAGEPLSLACRDPSLPDETVVREAMAASARTATAVTAARDAGFDAIAAR
ncbi:MAG TPA: hypothetical protein VE309_11020, partial [Caulobacteraceae bacterium]|nr:hypothetical protein [Caulobacteraceae bacterium]